MAHLSRSASTPDGEPWNRRRHGTGKARAARSSYEIDRDRIIHSETFRELQDKTQVQSLLHAPPGMSSRTRLNHVIEVAQLARGLARELDADEPLAEAIALAHDLGHPPFGHAGERALRAALVELGEEEWNANVHSLAVVEQIERAFIGFRGLDLTWATREGIARHSTPFDEPVSFGEFAATRHGGLECQIVDAADVLAYVSHDLDDAIANGFVELDTVAGIAPALERLVRDAEERWDREGGAAWPEAERPVVIRRSTIARLIGEVIADLVREANERIAAAGIDGPDDLRHAETRVVAHSPEFERMTAELLRLLSERYYRSPVVAQADRAASELLRGLFDALLAEIDRVPERFRVDSDAIAVATYIASLNDRTATLLADELGVAQTVSMS